MKLLVLTLHDSRTGQQKQLIDSLNFHGYEYHEHIIPFHFGQQYHRILEFCKSYTGEATHICYTDAYDTLAFSSPDEVTAKFLLHSSDVKMLISCEKNCFPSHWRSVEYPECSTPWKFINGGGCLFEIEYFKYLCDKHPFKSDYIDPDWLLDCYLANPNEIKLDHNCEIFQTIAFSDPGEWFWNHNKKRLETKLTQTYPVFFHGNGHTEMDWVYKLAEQNAPDKNI